MDVAKPGKSAPSVSGRPVIVTHRPIIDDPMVKKDAKTEPGTTDATSRKVLQPLTAETDKPAEKPKNNQSDTTEKPQPDIPKSTAKTEETAVVGAVAEQATHDKKKDDEPDEEALKKQEHIDKLIESKKYFVPVGQVARRRNKRAGIAVLVVLLLLAGGYIAIDAGVIASDMELPVDLISN